jgi:hypothetical protein
MIDIGCMFGMMSPLKSTIFPVHCFSKGFYPILVLFDLNLSPQDFIVEQYMLVRKVVKAFVSVTSYQ